MWRKIFVVFCKFSAGIRTNFADTLISQYDTGTNCLAQGNNIGTTNTIKEKEEDASNLDGTAKNDGDRQTDKTD